MPLELAAILGTESSNGAPAAAATPTASLALGLKDSHKTWTLKENAQVQDFLTDFM